MSSCIDFGAVGADHLCYVQCKYCGTVLAIQKQHEVTSTEFKKDSSSSSKSSGDSMLPYEAVESETKKSVSFVPEKRQRFPSAYNRFFNNLRHGGML